MASIGVEFSITSILALPVQPLASVIVTAYVPPILTDIVCPTSPLVDQLYVANPAPASNTVVSPVHISVSPVIVVTSEASSVTVCISLLVQPFTSVTVTL